MSVGLGATDSARCGDRAGLDSAGWRDHVCGGQSYGRRRSVDSDGTAG